jgi:hypothetical protein
MTATTESPTPPAKPGVGWQFLYWTAGVFLFAMIALPGFALAFDTQVLPPYYFAGPSHAATLPFFYPSMKLARASRTMNKFYLWEYKLAGGKVVWAE